MANNQAFNSIQGNRLKRATHDLSHSRKFTMKMGDLVPILCQDVLPGDSFQISNETLMRLMPMIAPVYHNINVFVHYFFVPNRIIWDDWEDFITGGRNGDLKPVFPTFYRQASSTPGALGLSPSSLADYLGIPVTQFSQTAASNIIPLELAISQLPFRAYQTIYNDYYRDQNLEQEVNVHKASGSVQLGEITGEGTVWSSNALKLRKRAWEKDYFTSALPFTQRGPEMQLPIGGDAPIVTVDQATREHTQQMRIGNALGGGANWDVLAQGAMQGNQIVADMSQINMTTINELREAFQIQKWLERSARSGSRYTEVLQSFFGVRPRDSRLQRPEFLGGGKMPISVSEVIQTSETNTTGTPLGEFAGHGITYGSTGKFRKFFTEHGYVIGIMSVMPRTAYMQGLQKHWFKFDKHEFFWQEFAHLGEQEIEQREIYFDPTSIQASKHTFGYTARYNEYRYIPDTVHGSMLDSLSYWHMARKFESSPVLNKSFVESNPTRRIFANTADNDKLIVQTYCNFRAIRPVPKYGDPLGI